MAEELNMVQVKNVSNSIFVSGILKLIGEGHSVKMTIKGRSMRPFIEHNRDQVVLVKIDGFSVGDVVLAKTIEKGYVIHRISKLDETQCVLRGDGNLDEEHCEKEDIVAKVSSVVRKGHNYDTNGKIWRAYSWCWVSLLPVRRYLLAAYRLLAKV